ncbi:MAG: hypothetical protein KDC55_12240 [Ignavibacteriae bacterium]|nr:hypothetical protein [Flavobacteriaceae bacterium]MCB0703467.1 hypothetical protein [Ignavibacteriota bacterium]
MKYLNAPDSIEYRDRHFNFKYEKGFLFHSKCFHGVAGDFPIGFLIWNLQEPRSNNIINVDISNSTGTTIGIKHLKLIDKKDVLNNWFNRPENSKDYILPALSNGITVKQGNADTRHRARPDFLASICSKGNDFQNAKYVTILSSPNVSAGAFTVTENIFDKSLVLFAVRKIPKPTWLNDRNQFLIPNKILPTEFINDCIIWSLFSNSNQTTSLRSVKYFNRIYNIRNNFFPFTIDEIKKWEIRDPDMKIEMVNDTDRFVANWISKNTISEESKRVLSAGRIVYKAFFSNINKMATHKWKIESWDAGWYQIRRCLVEHGIGKDELEELSKMHDLLGTKILPQIEEYGFLDKDEVFDEI